MTQHALPYGWSQEDVDREPMRAILEHTYGNCPCDTPEKCLCAIAAIGEATLPKEETPEQLHDRGAAVCSFPCEVCASRNPNYMREQLLQRTDGYKLSHSAS